VAFFNLAKFGAKLLTARKITTYVVILASPPCDAAGELQKSTRLLIARLLADVAKFVNRDVLQPLALSVKLLVDFNRGLLHSGVRLLGTASQKVILAACDACMSILSVQTQS
jgi:hypothetical protein